MERARVLIYRGEINLEDQPVIRALFERAMFLEFSYKTTNLCSKKLYLEYEEEHRDEASVERAKKAAMAFVKSRLTQADL